MGAAEPCEDTVKRTMTIAASPCDFGLGRCERGIDHDDDYHDHAGSGDRGRRLRHQAHDNLDRSSVEGHSRERRRASPDPGFARRICVG